MQGSALEVPRERSDARVELALELAEEFTAGIATASDLVPRAGLEPARRDQAPADFKSAVSTSFTTRAGKSRSLYAGRDDRRPAV